MAPTRAAAPPPPGAGASDARTVTNSRQDARVISIVLYLLINISFLRYEIQDIRYKIPKPIQIHLSYILYLISYIYR